MIGTNMIVDVYDNMTVLDNMFCGSFEFNNFGFASVNILLTQFEAWISPRRANICEHSGNSRCHQQSRSGDIQRSCETAWSDDVVDCHNSRGVQQPDQRRREANSRGFGR